MLHRKLHELLVGFSHSIQLISNFYFGIALDFVSKYTTATRAWRFGDNRETATDEFYILEWYVNCFALATEALARADQLSEVT
ncbi:Thermophilic desulfurizing enzyme family protein [Penicillium cf. griseofulvum]|uniref:Thermophilic desulfurizing enzyme family protein n=1 Tax=Penicillium cf. griseofulvum TaxID=2972120 RepID=A0A9W9T2R1_9EURO|nr:Thermophilic desulfurizing enzyme family protein [Penicillium cf. griseofulvum]KAJ5446145.1 Thermophilic desulfurizing enzyme family protein [Penicillium cf. griseofulvum]KAJ5447886.1 Thermophilic desulfurizing enzyme family protein [Penicillium cf. griseofulvum]